MEETELQIVLISTLLTATFTDLAGSKIPNWLTFPGMTAGLVAHTLGNGLAGFLHSLRGLGVGFGLFFILYLLGSMGAGDVKLLGTVGSLIGPSGVLSASIVIGIVGGLCAIGMILQQWGWQGTVAWIRSWATYIILTGQPPVRAVVRGQRLSLRYGPVIAVGTMLSQFGFASLVTG
jgi:prepilin peptidase CpaA